MIPIVERAKHWRALAKTVDFPMQDAALFFRHLAYASFNRRRKYPLLSAEWQREVDDARSFIRHARSVYPPRTGADLIAALQASPYREIDIEPER